MQKEYNNISHLVYICNFYKLIVLYNIRNTQYNSTYSNILDKKSLDDDDHELTF